MKQVAALFVRADSVYKRMDGVDCWDSQFDSTPPEMAEWLVELARRTSVNAMAA